MRSPWIGCEIHSPLNYSSLENHRFRWSYASLCVQVYPRLSNKFSSGISRSQEPRQQIFVPRNVVAVFREFSACSQERFPGIIPYELLWKSVGQGRSKRIAAFPVVAGVSQHS